MNDNVHMLKDAILTVRVPAELKDALYAAAEEEMRTPASLATKILTEYFRATGDLPRSHRQAKARRERKEKRR